MPLEISRASIVATDMADLRAALDRGAPFVRAIYRYADLSTPTLVIVRTRTAAKALVVALQQAEGGLGTEVVAPLSSAASGAIDIARVMSAAEALLGRYDGNPNVFRFGNLTITGSGLYTGSVQ